MRHLCVVVFVIVSIDLRRRREVSQLSVQVVANHMARSFVNVGYTAGLEKPFLFCDLGKELFSGLELADSVELEQLLLLDAVQ